jgi:hypothetical protein
MRKSIFIFILFCAYSLLCHAYVCQATDCNCSEQTNENTEKSKNTNKSNHKVNTRKNKQKSDKNKKKEKKEKKEAKEPEDNGLPYIVAVAVFPLDKGLYEVVVFNYYQKGRDHTNLYMQPEISYGINDKWQVYIDVIPYITHRESLQTQWSDNIQAQGFGNIQTQGFGDIDFGTEYSWMYIHKSTLSAAFYMNFHLPTGGINSHLTDGFIRYEPFLLLAKDIVHATWRTQFFSQIGFSIVQRLKTPINEQDIEPAAHSFIINSGIAARMKNVNYSLELDWQNNKWNNRGDKNILYLTPTIYLKVKNCFKLAETIALGLAVPVGLTKSADKYWVVATLLVDIPTLPPKDENNNSNSNDTPHPPCYARRPLPQGER